VDKKRQEQNKKRAGEMWGSRILMKRDSKDKVVANRASSIEQCMVFGGHRGME